MMQINKVILLRLGFMLLLIIYLNIIKNYLKELEYRYAEMKKDIYINKYKKEDIIVYRKVFLE